MSDQNRNLKEKENTLVLQTYFKKQAVENPKLALELVKQVFSPITNIIFSQKQISFTTYRSYKLTTVDNGLSSLEYKKVQPLQTLMHI